MKRNSFFKHAAIMATLVLFVLIVGNRATNADELTIDFDGYTTGAVHGQDGWSSSGAAGSGCAIYDHAIVDNTYGYGTFGTRSLRMSNAVTSGCFGDQTFSKSLVDEAGESTAENGGLSGGARQISFAAEWDFASTVPGSEQSGLSVVASPDRGDGARMSWVQMTDTPTGLEVNFYDYQQFAADFVFTNVASSLDRTVPHTIRIEMEFVDGVADDIVRVYVDGVLGHTGTSWEDYFRDVEGNPSRTVDSILFRTGGTAVPATAGNGFLIDNLTLTTPLPCTERVTNIDTTEQFCTIQAAIDDADTLDGHTIEIDPGTYAESVVVDKVLTLNGAGNGTNPAVDTLITPSSPGMTITTGGTSVANRVVISNLTVTGASGGGNTGSGFLIQEGDATIEHITFMNVTATGNSGNGIAIDHTGTVGDIIVDGCNLSNNDNTGFRIPSSITTFDGLQMSNCQIDDNGINGLSTGPSGSPGVTNIHIIDTTFSGNGDALSTSGSGSGDLSFFKFNGDASLTNVDITGDGAHIGVQLRGSDTLAPAGTVSFDNVTINGQYQHPTTWVGSGLFIASYSDLSSVSFSNVSLNVAPVGVKPVINLYTDGLTGDLDINDTTLGGNASFDILHLSTGAVDATSATFTGAADNFAIEDRVVHVIDLGVPFGLVTWVADNVYVTVNSFAAPTTTAANIQRGIDAVNTGGTVNVGPGTFTSPAQVVISKDVTVLGISPTDTILVPGFDTGSSGDSRGWFLVNSSVEFHLSDLTLDGSGRKVWQAIRHKGTGTIDNVHFTEIKFEESGPAYAGTAVAAFGDGPVNITNSIFTEIGRVGVLYFGTGVNGSIFDSNSYTGKGDGDFLDYMLDISAGAVVEVTNNQVSDNRGIASVDDSTSAGILITTYFGTGTEATITGNTLTNNSTGIFVGFDGSDTSVVTANRNAITGNGSGFENVGTTESDATCNWWGVASGPSGEGAGSGDSVSVNAIFAPWLTSSDLTGECDAAPDLSLAKDDGDVTKAPGDTLVYTLDYENLTTMLADNVTLTEVVPANTSFNAAASTAGWSCTPDSSAGSTCTLNVGTVTGLGSDSALFAVDVDTLLAAGVGEIANSANISDDGNNGADANLANNDAGDTTPVDAEPDLALTKSDGAATAVPGSTIAYTLQVTNNGNQGATGIQFSETVPANTSFNPGASTAGWSCTPNNNAGSSCTLTLAGSLAGSGATSSATFAVTVLNPVAAGVTQISNSASVSDDGSNGTAASTANASDTTPVDAEPDLALTKSDGGATAVPGSTIAYTLQVTNNGNQGATGIQFTETVPANTTFNPGASTAGWSCTPNNNAGSSCTLTLAGSLAGGGATSSVTFAVTVLNPIAPSVTQISNSVSVSDDGSNGTAASTANASDTTAITNRLYLSSSSNGSIPPYVPSYEKEDILVFNPSDGSWAMYFDGSDVAAGDVDAFTILEDGSILMSFAHTQTLPGIGEVDDADIVKFIPTSLGNSTAGSYRLFLDGSDVGLDDSDDDINGISISPDGRLVITVDGHIDLPGLVAEDEDLLVFNAHSFGANSSGTWQLYFDGSDVYLKDEELECVSIDLATNNLYLAVEDNLNTVPGFPADRDDVFLFDPSSLGSTTAGSYLSIFFNGDLHGFANEQIDGCALGEDGPVLDSEADLRVTKTDSSDPVTAGDNILYTVTVTNYGPNTATNVVLVDTLPAGVTFVVATPGSPTCTYAAGKVTCNLGNLSSSNSAVVTIEVTTSSAGTLTNKAKATASTFDPAPANNEDTETTQVNPVGGPPSGDGQLYVSSSSGGTVQGIPFADEDVLFFDGANWSMFLDISDVLSSVDVDAFVLLNDGSVLLSFDASATVPGVGSVTDADIVRFVPSSTGNNTAGTFTLYFDGSDVGLSSSDEDIDALGITPDGRLLLSTIGNFSVPGVSGADEDLFAFTPTNLGSSTTGTFSLYFDGSDVSLTSSGEDINGAWLDGVTGQLYLTTVDDFSVPGLSGTDSDVFLFTPSSLGSSTSGIFGPGHYFEGAAHGFGSERIDALAIGPVAAP